MHLFCLCTDLKNCASALLDTFAWFACYVVVAMPMSTFDLLEKRWKGTASSFSSDWTSASLEQLYLGGILRQKSWKVMVLLFPFLWKFRIVLIVWREATSVTVGCRLAPAQGSSQPTCFLSAPKLGSVDPEKVCGCCCWKRVLYPSALKLCVTAKQANFVKHKICFSSASFPQNDLELLPKTGRVKT